VSEIRLEVDAKSVEQRFKDLPGVVNVEVENAMRKIVGDLYDKVLDNIEGMFSHDRSTGRKQNLESSILGTVTREGDLIIGTVGADLATAPYARILELGGVIPAHAIRPKSARLAIHEMSMSFPWEPDDTYSVIGDYLVSRRGHALVVNDLVLLEEVHHPGAKIHPYYYLNKALIDLSKKFNNDIELAVASAISRTGMS
jgi:hypothetical protein